MSVRQRMDELHRLRLVTSEESEDSRLASVDTGSDANPSDDSDEESASSRSSDADDPPLDYQTDSDSDSQRSFSMSLADSTDGDSSNDEMDADSAEKPRAERERQFLMNSTHYLIPRDAIKRLVLEITQDHGMDLRWTSTALAAMHTAVEDHLLKVLIATNDVAITSGRITIKAEHMRAVMNITKGNIS